MKKFEFYLNAETLILTKEFTSLEEASRFCKLNYSNYWNIEIKRKASGTN